MFRTRKEDSLFDNTTDPNEILESATVISAPPAAAAAPVAAAAAANAAAAAPAQPAAQTYTSAQSSQPAQPQPARPLPAQEAARATSPNAPAFRPNTGADLQRNRLPEAAKPAAAATAIPAAPTERPNVRSNQRVLTVGNDILLKGEIATCDRLVIEGKVDATLNDVHTVEIAQSGSFKGSAHIEDAEISGLFEGDLIVRNRLVIYATGKVRGKITYGEIEIERGGELTGEIKTVAQSSSTGRKSEKAAA